MRYIFMVLLSFYLISRIVRFFARIVGGSFHMRRTQVYNQPPEKADEKPPWDENDVEDVDFTEL